MMRPIIAEIGVNFLLMPAKKLESDNRRKPNVFSIHLITDFVVALFSFLHLGYTSFPFLYYQYIYILAKQIKVKLTMTAFSCVLPGDAAQNMLLCTLIENIVLCLRSKILIQ